MSSGVDAVSKESMRVMLTAYRNLNDPTGAQRKANAIQASRKESPQERLVKKGKNDAAVYVELSTKGKMAAPKVAQPNPTGHSANHPGPAKPAAR
ncbi:MAG: hypothetical protein HQL73_07390 [Magnetococcales bacterium]|nr:hypothetical protein [Magnetococcales bacterium]